MDVGLYCTMPHHYLPLSLICIAKCVDFAFRGRNGRYSRMQGKREDAGLQTSRSRTFREEREWELCRGEVVTMTMKEAWNQMRWISTREARLQIKPMMFVSCPTPLSARRLAFEPLVSILGPLFSKFACVQDLRDDSTNWTSKCVMARDSNWAFHLGFPSKSGLWNSVRY